MSATRSKTAFDKLVGAKASSNLLAVERYKSKTLFKKSSMKARLDLMILSSLWIASRIRASGIAFGLDSMVDMMKLCAKIADESGFRICGAPRGDVERYGRIELNRFVLVLPHAPETPWFCMKRSVRNSKDSTL